MVMSNLILDPIAASNRGNLRPPRAAPRPLPLFFAEGGDVQVVDPATLSADEYEAWLGSSFMAAPAPDQTPMTPEQLAALTGIYQDVVRPSLASIGDIIQQSQERAETRAAQAEMPSMRAATDAEQAQATLRDLQGGGFLGSQNIPGLAGGVLGQGAAAFTDTFRGIGAVPFGGQQFIEQQVRPFATEALTEIAPYITPGMNLLPSAVTRFGAEQAAAMIPSSLGEVFLLGLGGERVAADATARTAGSLRGFVPDAAALRSSEITRLAEGIVGGAAPRPWNELPGATGLGWPDLLRDVQAERVAAAAADQVAGRALPDDLARLRADLAANLRGEAPPTPVTNPDEIRQMWREGVGGADIPRPSPRDILDLHNADPANGTTINALGRAIQEAGAAPPVMGTKAEVAGQLRTLVDQQGIPSNLPRAADVTGRGEAGRLVPAGEAPPSDLPPPPLPATSGAPPPINTWGELATNMGPHISPSQLYTQARRIEMEGAETARRMGTAATGEPPAFGPGVVAGSGGAIPPASSLTAGLPKPQADFVTQWLESSTRLLDNLTPTQVGRKWAAVENFLLGREADPFLAGLQDRINSLEQGLAKTMKSATPEARQAKVNSVVDTLLSRHFQGNGNAIYEAKQTLARIDARAAELAKDFKVTSTLTEQVKNMMFPIDIGFGGQQGLAGLHNANIPLALSLGNRLALAAHIPGALNLEASFGMDRMLVAMNAGVDFSRAGSSLNPSAGTLLRNVPVLSAVDKHLITPIIEGLTDLQFRVAGGFMKMLDFEGELMLLRAAGRDIRDPKVLAQAGKQVNDNWSTARTATAPGRAMLERGTLLSPSMTRAQVNRIVNMVQLLNPAASIEQRVMAAGQITSRVAGLMGLGYLANEALGGVTPWESDITKSMAGKITLPTRDSNGAHQVINILPQATLERALARSYEAIKNEDLDKVQDIWTRFAFGRANPLLASAVRLGAGAGYDSNGRFQTGGMSLKERVQASLPMPPIAQNVIKGRTDPLTLGITSLGLSEYAESGTTELHRVANAQLLSAETLSQIGLPPEIIPAIQGKDYYELPSAVQVQLKAANPELVARIEDEARKANNPWQVIYRDGATEVDKRFADSFYKDAQNLLNNGPSDLGYKDGDKRINFSTGIKEIQQMQFDEKDALFQKALAESNKKGGGDYKPSEIQQLVQQYYELGNKFDKPDGSFDYKGYQAATSKFVLDIEARDKDLAYLLTYSVQPKQQTEPVLAMFQSAKENEVKQWNDNRTANPGTQNGWRAANPSQDAVLWYLGYVPDVRSTQAIEFAKMLTEGGSRQPALATSGIVRR